VRAIRGVPEFLPDRSEHGEDRAVVAAAFARAKENEERRAHDAEPRDPLAIEQTAEGVRIGDLVIREGRGAERLSEAQVEALAAWCVEHGRANLIANVRRARQAHHAAAERQKREHEQKLDRHRRQAAARQAVRDVEHLEIARDKAELDLGRLVTEDAEHSEIVSAEERLSAAERQVVRATAAARWLRKQASF
jgi:hypothetical protein